VKEKNVVNAIELLKVPRTRRRSDTTYAVNPLYRRAYGYCRVPLKYFEITLVLSPAHVFSQNSEPYVIIKSLTLRLGGTCTLVSVGLNLIVNVTE